MAQGFTLLKRQLSELFNSISVAPSPSCSCRSEQAQIQHGVLCTRSLPAGSTMCWVAIESVQEVWSRYIFVILVNDGFLVCFGFCFVSVVAVGLLGFLLETTVLKVFSFSEEMRF